MIQRRTSLRLGGVLVALLVTSISLDPISALAVSSTSIELEGIRWNRFPLKVLVDMNQWSEPVYALAVREAVDNWMRSILTYSDSFNETALRIICCVFYVSNVNATTSYDVLITFTPNEISSDVVGLTTFRWNVMTHEPLPPLIIKVTTYSGTASRTFVKNVVMHEFGHALGLGHALSQHTLNGPELMYFMTPIDRVVYPSTLDLYALTMLYKGSFTGSVRLPTAIAYEMVVPTADILPDTEQYPAQPDSAHILQSLSIGLSAIIRSIEESDSTDLAMLAAFLLATVLVSTLSRQRDREAVKVSGMEG